LVQKRDYLAWHNVVLTFLASFLFALLLLNIITAPAQAEIVEAMEDPSVTPDASFMMDPWFILFQTIILDGVIIWLTWHQVVRRRVIPRSEMGISRSQLRDTGKMAKWTAIGIGFGLGFFALATLVELGQRLIYNPEEAVELMPDRGDMGGFAMFFVATCILAPLSEEFFFRGYGFYAFNKRFGLFYALIFSAFLFSIAHVNLWGMIPIFVGGIGLALAFYLTRSLVTAIVAHAVYNFTILFLYWFGIG
jgi:membrane protease YdiL (CAAX protease family)